MKLTQMAIKRPVTTFMFFLAIVFLGFVSWRELSVDLLPNISYPRLAVVSRYAGVAPVDIENQLTSPLEVAVSTIPGLHRVKSVSKEGLSFLIIDFNWGTDMDFALLRTREKLDNVRHLLPEDAERPLIIPLDPQCSPIMILAVSGQRSLLELREFSEELIKPRLEQVEGIGSAEIAGGVEQQIQVEINSRLLALHGLTINQVAERIRAFNRNLQGGSIRKGRFKHALRIVGEFEQISEIKEVILKTTEDRGIIRLKDVAQIHNSIKEPMGITKLNGEVSIGILIRKEARANILKATQKARSVLESIKKENPQIKIVVVFERAKYIEKAILSIWRVILFGGILAFWVLFIFLQDLKTSITIAVVIPVSIIATFNLLYFRNMTLNIMSLGGLSLGVGMLVDNSIVVSESIFRHLSQGKNLIDAAYTGTKEVGRAVTASTLTTISVFLPVIYVQGAEGQLFKDQAFTVTFTLLSSLLVSLTFLPMFSSRKFELTRKNKEISEKEKRLETTQKQGKKTELRFFFELDLRFRRLSYFVLRIIFLAFNFFASLLLQLFLLLIHYLSLPFRPLVSVVFKGFNLGYERFASLYHTFLWWSLENKRKVLMSSLVFLGFTFFLSTQVGREFMPNPKTASIELNCRTPAHYSLEQTEEIVSSVEKWFHEEDIKVCFSQTGLVSGLESFNPDVSLNSSRIYVELQSSSQLEGVIERIRHKLESFPDLDYSIVRERSSLAQFLAFQSTELSLKIKGDDLDKLKDLTGQLIVKLRDIKGIAGLKANIVEGKPEFLIKINKEALERYANLSPAEIGDFLVNAVRGKVAAQFKEMDRKYDILVMSETAKRLNIDSLLNKQIPYEDTLIPLRELVSYSMAKGPEEIRRENQQREVLVTAHLQGAKMNQVIPKVTEKIDELNLSTNYQIVFGGEQEEMKKSFRSLIFALSLAVLLVYMVMAAQFESLLHPFLILFTLPLGLAGTVWALFLTGKTLNVISITGMVVLAGIVVNDGIVKIDYTNQLKKKGLGLREAIMEASRVRLRPILMTTMTTVFGLLPLSLGLGKGAELQQPLAISVIGGLILATFLTLVIIPVVYELVERKEYRFKK